MNTKSLYITALLGATLSLYANTDSPPIESNTESIAESSVESNASHSSHIHSSHNHATHDKTTSFLDNIYAHVGFFGKTNMFNKTYRKKDDYINFNASLGLQHNLFDTIELGLGIYGMTGIRGWANNTTLDGYIDSKFIANEAYIKYANDVDFFSMIAGRYHANRSWLKHYVQGVSINTNYSWFNFWGDWIDEQAHANREHLMDFTTFKNAYNTNGKGQWLGAVGIDLKIYGVDFSPYYYTLNNHFWTLGGKIGLLFDIDESWSSNTTLHYAQLTAKTTQMDHRYHNMSNMGNHSSHNLAITGDSKILWIDETISYKQYMSELLFGLGFIKVWDNNFALASLGNESRFETHSHGSFGVIEPGGLVNGRNFSNMFDGKTTTIYGFAGFDMDFLSMMFLGRHSQSSNRKQDSYSLGIKYKIIEGLNIGGVGAYMLQNKTNMSFLKAYIEFAI